MSGWSAGTCASKTLPGTTGRAVPGEQEVRQMTRSPKRLAAYLRLSGGIRERQNKKKKVLGFGTVGRELAQHAQSSGFYPRHCIIRLGSAVCKSKYSGGGGSLRLFEVTW